jgi:hypothetical protein
MDRRLCNNLASASVVLGMLTAVLTSAFLKDAPILLLNTRRASRTQKR